MAPQDKHSAGPSSFHSRYSDAADLIFGNVLRGDDVCRMGPDAEWDDPDPDLGANDADTGPKMDATQTAPGDLGSSTNPVYISESEGSPAAEDTEPDRDPRQYHVVPRPATKNSRKRVKRRANALNRCFRCKASFCSVENLRLHTESTGHYVQCRSCPERMSLVRDIVDHFKMYRQRHEIRCDCGKYVFRNIGAWLGHARWCVKGKDMLLVGSGLAVTDAWIVHERVRPPPFVAIPGVVCEELHPGDGTFLGRLVRRLVREEDNT